MRTLVLLAAAAGVLAGFSLATHRRRERDRVAVRGQPEPLQTWEDEGGAVPLRTGRTAAQVTPSASMPGVGEGEGPVPVPSPS
jgi:hypothetical protein